MCVGGNRPGTHGTATPGAVTTQDTVNGKREQSRITWADVVRTGRVATKEEGDLKIVSSALCRNNPVS